MKNLNIESEHSQERPIKLRIEYSPQLEVTRIRNVIEKLDWYKEQGYVENSFLPHGIRREKIRDLTEERIGEIVSEEYDEDLYKEVAARIWAEWEKFSENGLQNLSESGLELQSEYRIRLTKYGPSGSYNYPDLVVLRISEAGPERTLKVIIHEIIHLAIQPYIEKHSVPHWKKERLVDLIFQKILPKLTTKQNIKEKVDDVDESFDHYFPDIEKIAKVIGATNKSP